MKTRQAVVEYTGPFAEHDMPCAVYGCANPAVLLFGSPGTFQPCWSCQRKGYALVRRSTSRLARLWRAAFAAWQVGAA